MKPMTLMRGAAVGLATLVALAACGSTGDSGNKKSGPPLVIGYLVPLTSGNATVAQQMVNTAKLAVKTINASGGAGGRQLELKVYDDKLTADESAKVTQRALTVDGAKIIMGGYTSIEGLAIKQFTEARKVIFINASTISPALTANAHYTFRLAHDQADYPLQMVDLLKSLGYKRPVVTADGGPTGATLFQPIVDAAKSAGLTPGETVKYILAATDLTNAVAELKQRNPDSVVHIGSSAADAGLMLKTMDEQGVKVPVVGFGSLIAPDALRIGGAAYSDLPGVYTLANQQPSKPQYRDFIDAYAKEFGGSANDLALGLAEQCAATWDSFEVLKRALEVTKGDTGGDKLFDALVALPAFEGAAGKSGSQIKFDKEHDAFSKALVAFKFVNGKPTELK